MENNDANTDYHKFVTVGDQKWEIVEITIGITFFAWDLYSTIEKTQEIFQKEKIYTFQWEKITEFAFHSFLCVQTLLVFWFHSSHKFFMLLCTIDFWFVSIFLNKDIQHFDLYFLPQHIQWCCYKIASSSILYPNHGISVSNNRHWIMCPLPMNILIEKNVDRWNNTEGSFIQYLRKIFRKNNISYSLIRKRDNL